jgi:nitrate/nitrite transporter NarK
VLGSLSFAWGEHAPGLLAAGLCLVNMIFAWRFLRESHDFEGARASGGRRVRRSREAVWAVVTHSGEPASRLIWIYAIAMGAFQGMTAVLALFLAVRFGVTEKTIGYFFMYIGAISVLTRAGILGPMVDRLGEARLSRLGTLLLALGLTAIPFTHTYLPLALAVALVPLGTAFTFPCITSLLSRVISQHERGLYMGVQQTFGGVARVLGPIGAGLGVRPPGRRRPLLGRRRPGPGHPPARARDGGVHPAEARGHGGHGLRTPPGPACRPGTPVLS